MILQIKDNSENEIGFIIYKSIDFSAPAAIDTIISLNPISMNDTIFSDNNINTQHWYSYQIEAYNLSGNLSSEALSVFAFGKRKTPKHIIISRKLSDFPISYDKWALKNGSSIVVNERNAPNSQYSKIDITNPEQPVFKGYIGDPSGTDSAGNHFTIPLDDSSNYLSYFSYNNLLFVDTINWPDPNKITLCQYKNNNLIKIGSIIVSGPQGGKCNFFNAINNNTYLTRLPPSNYSWDSCYGGPGAGGYVNYYIFYADSQVIHGLGHYSDILYSSYSNSLCFKGFYNGISYESNSWHVGPLTPGQSSGTDNAAYDFRLNPLAPIKSTFDNIITDYQLFGYIIPDSIHANANTIFIDTSSKLAIKLTNTFLTIYSYTIDTTSQAVSYAAGSQFANKISIYLNPFNSVLTIHFPPNITEKKTVQIYDLLGRCCFFRRNIVEDNIVWKPRALSGGVYICNVMIGNKSTIKSIVLKK
jgi:hypothetical protein